MADEEIENMDEVLGAILQQPKGREESREERKPVNGRGQEQDEADEAEVQVDAREEIKKRGIEQREEEESGERGEPDESSQSDQIDKEVEDEEDIDIDTIELEVTVDGEVRKVPISELKARYSHQGAVDKRLQEVTQGRAKIAEQSNQLNQVLTHQMARLKALDGILENAEKPNVNMDELRIKDPTRYLFEKERQREIQERRYRIAQEAEKINSQQDELRQAALLEHSRSEFVALGRADPMFANPKTAPAAMNRLYKGAEAYRFTQQEVAGVMDHRVLLALSDAVKWQEYVAKRAGQTKAQHEARTEPRPLLKPGVRKTASSPVSREQRQMKALRDKARQSGRPDDVAATLIVRGPGKR